MIASLKQLVDDASLRRRYVARALFAIVVRAATVLLLFPLLARLFSSTPGAALPWMAALLVAVVMGWFADRALSLVGFDIGFGMLVELERRVLAHVERLPLNWLTPDRRAVVQKALTTSGHELCTGVAYLITPAVTALGSTALVGLGLIFVSPEIGLAALGSIPVIAGAMWLGGRLMGRAEATYAQAATRAGRGIEQLARAQRVLRAAGRANTGGGPLGALLDQQHAAARRLVRDSIPGQVLFALVATAVLLALAGLVAWQGLQGTLTPAEVVALLVVIVRFHEPFTSFAALGPAMTAMRAGLERVNQVLGARVLPEPVVSAIPEDGGLAIALENVCFRHDADGPLVLEDLSLEVPAGTTTAIVGPSGSGKSTLLSLLARVGDAESGVVRLRGHDVRSYGLDVLMAQLGIVFQDVYLFEGTLKENVLLGNPHATDAALARAAHAAQLDEVLARLPDGWDSPVGEGGDLLSGGEKQRVSIARALLKQSPILLLDEASSALDTHNERALIEALEAEASARTTVVVAHRLQTIARADQIVFLEAGRIVERGSFEALRTAGGRFAAYWAARERAGTWGLAPAGAVRRHGEAQQQGA